MAADVRGTSAPDHCRRPFLTAGAPEGKDWASTGSARTLWTGMTLIFPTSISPVPALEAPRDCPLCPRLVGFREALREEHPDWWNAPVPHFGDPAAWLAICGLAPGKQG